MLGDRTWARTVKGGGDVQGVLVLGGLMEMLQVSAWSNSCVCPRRSVAVVCANRVG